VTDWFEAGLYLPLYSISGAGAPDAGEQRFFSRYEIFIRLHSNSINYLAFSTTTENPEHGWHGVFSVGERSDPVVARRTG
jgi:hypothetical protein